MSEGEEEGAASHGSGSGSDDEDAHEHARVLVRQSFATCRTGRTHACHAQREVWVLLYSSNHAAVQDV